ncbi:hypothetical protein MTP99_009866 [Tenebrio molitor]|jgi:hypothetical protein|nr:hypothetical protein MTP99_009866 [Tenebrio molitor]
MLLFNAKPPPACSAPRKIARRDPRHCRGGAFHAENSNREKHTSHFHNSCGECVSRNFPKKLSTFHGGPTSRIIGGGRPVGKSPKTRSVSATKHDTHKNRNNKTAIEIFSSRYFWQPGKNVRRTCELPNWWGGRGARDGFA